MKNAIALSAGVALTAALVAPATASAQSEGVTLSPMVGAMFLDGDYELDDAPFGSLGFGYKFAGPGEVELTYLLGKAENDWGQTRYLDQIRLDYLHHFNEGNRVVPYGVVGVGHQRVEWWSTDRKTENTLVNAGAGMNVAMTDRLSFRADARVFHDIDYSFTNYTLAVGVRYLFGETSGPAPAAPTPTRTADSDNDGVPDSRDRCPDTPAGVQVDANGCEVTQDSDGDGVADARDRCPDTAAGARVDERGCYITLTETREVNMNVIFGNNSAAVDPASFAEIQQVADFMREYPQTSAVIEGHSDDRGEASYNQQLSQRRAQAVVEVLVNRFNVNRGRLRAVGYGEERPLVPNDSESNRAKNRRVTAQVSAQVETRQ